MIIYILYILYKNIRRLIRLRDPYKLNTIEEDDIKDNIINLEDVPEYDFVDWNLDDAKDFKAYIGAVKRSCRNSIEYKNFIKFLKYNLDMKQCSFFSDIDDEVYDSYRGVKVEIHHEPFTIEDIIGIVTRKRMAFYEDLDEESTAQEVMLLHYKLLVGLIPISTTVHKVVHGRYQFIPLNRVFGNYKKFIEIYKDFITDEQFEYIKDLEEATSLGAEDSFKKLFAKRYLYVDFNGKTTLPEYEKVKELLETRALDHKRTLFTVIKPSENI